MTHPGLLMRVHNIQKSNTPWFTGFTVTIFQLFQKITDDTVSALITTKSENRKIR
jgi:hypothetical protein